MQAIELKATHTTAYVCFDGAKGEFEISGKSLPENTFDFFQPLLDYFDSYVEQPQSLTRLVFKMEYFNTSSTKQILTLLKKAESLSLKGNQVEVNWYHDQDDEDMRDAGDDFQQIIKIPINIIGTEITG